MKSLVFLTTVLVSQMTFSAIKFSNYEQRHQDMIETAIYKNCGVSGVIIQLSSDEEVKNVDQGIRDVNYTTEIMVRVGVDQYQYDQYPVTVKSSYADMYDHGTKNWGAYSVDKVICQ
ncbi:MAG: hypothetical protein ABL930_04700 [Pseudobdellovibrio sp.]